MSRRRQNITCSPSDVIARSPQWELTRYDNGDTADIIETILYADTKSAQYIVNADCFLGRNDYETLYNIWHFVKRNLRYRPDRPGHERVKSPGALFTSGFGDCKSYSVATGAILRALGIPYSYRFTRYAPGDYTHVYTVAHTTDGDVILDSVYGAFDSEHPYHAKKDITPQQQAIAGLPGEAPAKSNQYLLAAAILFTLLFWK